MAMHDPPHPGGILRRQCLEPLGLSVTRAAEGLGVTRQALSDLVNGKAGVSMEMAIRLSKAFGSTPETWLGIQMAYDLWQARARAEEIMVEKFEPAEAALNDRPLGPVNSGFQYADLAAVAGGFGFAILAEGW